MFLSLGWIIAKVAMALTVLVLAFLSFYVVFNFYSHRRLQLEQERQREEQALRQQEEELKKKKERSRKVKDQLRLVKYHHTVAQQSCNCCDESSTCSTAECSAGHEYEQGEDPVRPELDIEAQQVIRSTPSTTKCSSSTSFETETDTATDSEAELEMYDEESYENCCPICFATFEEGELVSVSNNADCNHAFHRDCITEWLLKQDGCTCPVCRRCYLEEDRGDSDRSADGGDDKPTSTDEDPAHDESENMDNHESAVARQPVHDGEIDVDDLPV